MSRVEVLSGAERRRRWSAEQKRSIVAEAFGPGASVCEVARRRDVVPGQIYRWRYELRAAAAGFTEVVVVAGSDRGGERAAVMLTLIQTAKLNDVDPQAWIADALSRIADHKITSLAALLPWNWRRPLSASISVGGGS